MLPALGTLATQQATPTKNTMKKNKQFLDYASTNPSAVVTYHASNMVLAGHSDALHFSKSMHKAEPEVISSCQAMWSYRLTMARSAQYCRSSKQWCLWRQKPKSGHSSSIAMKQCQQGMSSNSWDTHNRPHLCRWTTQQPCEWWIKMSWKNWNRWTWNTASWDVESARSNSNIIGLQESQT